MISNYGREHATSKRKTVLVCSQERYFCRLAATSVPPFIASSPVLLYRRLTAAFSRLARSTFLLPNVDGWLQVVTTFISLLQRGEMPSSRLQRLCPRCGLRLAPGRSLPAMRRDRHAPELKFALPSFLRTPTLSSPGPELSALQVLSRRGGGSRHAQP